MLFWRHEAKLPAEEAKACPDPRVPRSSRHQDRTSCPQAPPPEGARAPCALMPPKYRLSRADFTRMRGFRRIQGRFSSLSYGTLPGRTHAGAAIVVSKKAAAHAVDRNRIKRRSRAIFSRFLRDIPAPVVLVAVAKRGAAEAEFDEFSKDLENLISRATLGSK